MKKYSFLLAAFLLTTWNVLSQGQAGLFRYPDVSSTHIVFSYSNDLWMVSKEGGTAWRLSSPSGMESYPKFSPDGKRIAYSANYDGNRDVYLLPSTGGVAERLTWHGLSDRMVDWHPDGRSLVFASLRESEKERFSKFFSIPTEGGMATCLPMAYAEFGSYSPDGKRMALVFETQVGRTWKRYRGGNVADIHIFNFSDNSSENISADNDAGDEFPMWHGNTIYFLSDRGEEKRLNLWSYDLTSRQVTQMTRFADYDVHYPSLGNDDIIFEQGGQLYLFNLASKTYKAVTVQVPNDGISQKPRLENVGNLIRNTSLSTDGNRVIMEARGELFDLPAEHGYVKNLTQTNGAAERYPAWSPDGNTLAFWSDRSGEYELWFRENGRDTKVSSLGAGYRYHLFWSPDSRKIAFCDKAMVIYVFDRNSKTLSKAGKLLRAMHGTLESFTCSWSPDSRYLAYSRDLDNNHQAVFAFDTKEKRIFQVTSGYYSTFNPVFDPEGKYLYLLTDMSFNPTYSNLDGTFIYANSTHIAAMPLDEGTPSPLFVRNDSVKVKKETPTDDGKKDKKPGKQPAASDARSIIWDGMESRMVLLTKTPGNYVNLSAGKKRVYFQHVPNSGSNDFKIPLKFYDLEKREVKTVLDDAGSYQLSGDMQKILVVQGNKFAIIKAEEGQKMDKSLPTGDMEVTVDPHREWEQIYLDAWRIERDFFYDSAMHGVNWAGVREQYKKMIPYATNREEVNFILGEMIGELNASHTYRYGGDEENELSSSVGYLGVDWEADGNYYRIKRILKAADWDVEARSPLNQPGINLREGDYILSVNGIPLTTDREPYAAFQGLAGKTVELTYNSAPKEAGAHSVVVELMGSELRLRHLAWIEKNRRRVEQATNGEAGYVYVESTGVFGQNELMRQFNAQWDKKSMIIDERFNNGGQIPDRFIEMLNRPPLVYWSIRDGKSWPWPQFGHFGPKVMLINGWSGSGGDAFPDYFRKRGLGPLIGTRTWGGLIGISGAPELIDGGAVTVPTFRMYNLDGTWFGEGHGVDPDINVEEDLSQMAKGTDPQLERAITEINELMKKAFTEPSKPSPEKR